MHLFLLCHPTGTEPDHLWIILDTSSGLVWFPFQVATHQSPCLDLLVPSLPNAYVLMPMAYAPFHSPTLAILQATGKSKGAFLQHSSFHLSPGKYPVAPHYLQNEVQTQAHPESELKLLSSALCLAALFLGPPHSQHTNFSNMPWFT